MSKEQLMAQLKKELGKSTGPSSWMTVDQKRINQFADATGDHQWIHVDVERAKKESPYKSPIAHGFLTLSLLPVLNNEVSGASSSYPGVKLGVNYGLNKVRFPAPVPAGSRVRASSKLIDVSEIPGGVQLIREVTIETEGQKKPCCVAESISRLYFE
ncbi:MAG: MaoC family dehydratase [Candidatus Lambdaproteobacteria bacterium]|nr:MaoC family dehydratase [Candidatus Lambdaproteobacteria bacterium]